jgi:hypothetical protein
MFVGKLFAGDLGPQIPPAGDGGQSYQAEERLQIELQQNLSPAIARFGACGRLGRRGSHCRLVDVPR